MRKPAFTALVAAFTAAGGLPSGAMPVPGAPILPGGTMLVRDGCGWDGHRTPWGQCVPNYARPIYRACPPGYHLGPYRGRCFPNL